MSSSEKPNYYITTPIYYVNGLPHVGSALTTICCDVMARYKRLRGCDTWFLTGTDENATKVQEAAIKAGIDPREFVDGLSSAFRECWELLHVANDDFIRTTDKRHADAAQKFFSRLLEKGFVYLDTYEGWYSVSDETFLRENEVKDGVAIDSGKPVIRIQEQNYFFKLSAFEDRLLKHIEENAAFLQPDFRRNEVIGFIKEGLRDMSITRANKGWGIPVPGDESKVIYVWFEALINYLAAIGWPEDPIWEKRWPANLHYMGKEIFVRFHATLWPAMLMALDLPLPEQIYAHGWWTVEGGKKGGKTGPPLPHPTRFTHLIAERSGASFDLAADAQRYLLCREMNFGLDTEFTVENFLRRFNTDLANDLGNLLNRTVNMTGKYFDSVIPVETAPDPEIVALVEQVRTEYEAALRDFKLNVALEAVWKLVGRMNKYIDEQAPWALAKKGDEASLQQLGNVLYSCLEIVRIVSVFVAPFMPVASDSLRAQLGIKIPVADATWEDTTWGKLESGTKVAPPTPLFPRIQTLVVDQETLRSLASSNPVADGPQEKIEKVETPFMSDNVEDLKKTTAPEPEQKPAQPISGTPVAPPDPNAEEAVPLITIDDFMKVQLKVGEILAAEPIPNASKLLRLTVQLGEDDTRTILAGIAEYYQAEELVGRQVVVVANLQPRKMRGIESQGMLLAADLDGKAVLLLPDKAVPVGSKVR